MTAEAGMLALVSAQAGARAPVVFTGRLPAAFDTSRPKLAYDFWYGRLDWRDFPHAVWRRLLIENLSRAAVNFSGYGHPAGHPELHSAIANQLGATRGMVVDADRILITAGAQDGLNILSRLLLEPGAHVVVEDPCYEAAWLLFESYSTSFLPVPVDGDGLITAKLPEAPGILEYLLVLSPSEMSPRTGIAESKHCSVIRGSWSARPAAADVEITRGARMSGFMLGDLHVEPIVERSLPVFPPEFFFLTTPDDAIRKTVSWLAPNFYVPADNMLIMSMHSWLIRTRHHNILIDTCYGNDKERPDLLLGHRLSIPWIARLAAAGLRPDDIDFVMCTHLHADHVGWNTQLVDGRWVPTFKNARYLFGRREYEYWDSATGPATGGIGQEGVFADSVLPCMEAGLAQLIDDGHTLDDALTVEDAPGHTHGTLAIHANGKTQRGVFTGDIIHSPLQIAYPDVNSIACALPEAARTTRRRLLSYCAETGCLLTPLIFRPLTVDRSNRRVIRSNFLPELENEAPLRVAADDTAPYRARLGLRIRPTKTTKAKKMSYLVTGGSGLIGSRVVRDLVREGQRVVVYDLYHQELLAADELQLVTIERGDVTDLSHLLHAVKDNGVRKIIHLAALTTHPSAMNPPLAIRVNCEGTANVFEAARLLGLKKVVWASTRDVFGTADKYPDGIIPNDGAHYPASVYAASKSFCEVLATHYIRSYDLDLSVLRYFFAYGIGQRGSIIARFISELIEKPVAGKPGLVPYGDDSFGWLYVDDAARATVMLSKAVRPKTKAFTVGSSPRPVREAVEYVRTLLPGCNLSAEPRSLGPGNLYDTQPLKDEIGFQPIWTMEQGLKDSVNFSRRQNGLPPL